MFSKPQIRIAPAAQIYSLTVADIRLKETYMELFGIPVLLKVDVWTRTGTLGTETYDVNYVLEKQWYESCLEEVFPVHKDWDGSFKSVKFVQTPYMQVPLTN